MSALRISSFERRDGTDHAQLHGAALAFTKALRALPDVVSARFFWNADADGIAVVVEYATTEAMHAMPSDPNAGAAAFALFDLARPAGTLRLSGPATSAKWYQDAGRS
jgi:hypothetical protein